VSFIRGNERLIVVVGPSGSGKNSVLCSWVKLQDPQAGLLLVQRVITRPAAEPLDNHEGVSVAQFLALQEQRQLATTWQAQGLSFGVRTATLAPLMAGRWMVLNGSRVHLQHLRLQAPAMHVVEITAPPELRAARLAARSGESCEQILRRLDRRTPDAQAAVTLVNDGTLHEAIWRLQRWWVGQRRAAGV
jgi:phosphonate metabolism protein PhnN/1,5-bisphosphokinase (PRPP-forming)